MGLAQPRRFGVFTPSYKMQLNSHCLGIHGWKDPETSAVFEIECRGQSTNQNVRAGFRVGIRIFGVTCRLADSLGTTENVLGPNRLTS